MSFPYQLLKALAEGVQMGLEIIGGDVDMPPGPDEIRYFPN